MMLKKWLWFDLCKTCTCLSHRYIGLGSALSSREISNGQAHKGSVLEEVFNFQFFTLLVSSVIPSIAYVCVILSVCILPTTPTPHRSFFSEALKCLNVPQADWFFMISDLVLLHLLNLYLQFNVRLSEFFHETSPRSRYLFCSFFTKTLCMAFILYSLCESSSPSFRDWHMTNIQRMYMQ